MANRLIVRIGSRVRDLRTGQVGTFNGFTARGRGIVRLNSGRYVYPPAGEIQGKYLVGK